MLKPLTHWLSGYNPSILHNESAETTHIISLTGGLVGVAAAVTAANWGIAGFSLMDGTHAWIGAGIGSLAGATFALSVDRPGAFALDAQAPGSVRKLLILGTRIGACLLISAITTDAVLPLLLSKDGARVALEQREERDDGRAKMLNQRFDTMSLRTAAIDADKKAEVAATNLKAIPPAIAKKENDVKACSRKLLSKRAALSAKRTTEADRLHLAFLSATCTNMANATRRELTAFQAVAQKSLAEANNIAERAHEKLGSAEHTVSKRLAEAASIERDAITSASSIVGDNVLRSSPTARRKALSLYFLILLVELSPLTFKWLGGPSVPGSRIAVDHQLASARHYKRRDDAVHANETRLAVRDSVDEMLIASLQSHAVRERLTATFEGALEPFVAFDIYRRIVAEIEELQELRRGATQRCPDASQSINQLAESIVEDLTARVRDRLNVQSASARAA